MENKKLLNICECGDIHLIDGETYSNVTKGDGAIVLICAKCGSIKAISRDATAFLRNISKIVFGRNGGIILQYNNGNIDVINKNTSFIYYNKGISVPMKTGNYADHYKDGIWTDNTCPDLYRLFESLVTVNQYNNRIDMLYKDRETIDKHAFISKTCIENAIALKLYGIEPFKDMSYHEIKKKCPEGISSNLEKITESEKYFENITDDSEKHTEISSSEFNNNYTSFKDYRSCQNQSAPVMVDLIQGTTVPQYQQSTHDMNSNLNRMYSQLYPQMALPPNVQPNIDLQSLILENMEKNLSSINNVLDKQNKLLDKLINKKK